MNTITFEEFNNEVKTAIEKRPVYLRQGGKLLSIMLIKIL